MALLEVEYSINNLLGHFFSKQRFSIFRKDLNYLETKFGKFYLRKNTLDALIASPAFERRDVNFLFKQIDKYHKNKGRILFLDIGADFGYYTVVVLNHMKSSDLVAIAIEPTHGSFKLLNKNVKANKIVDRVKLFNLGVLDKSNKKVKISLNHYQPGSSSIKHNSQKFEIIEISTIDKLLSHKEIDRFDHIIMKMDTEGCESEILMGSKKLLDSKKKTLILVEDFVNPKVISTLTKLGARFICKLTDYNSWWEFN